MPPRIQGALAHGSGLRSELQVDDEAGRVRRDFVVSPGVGPDDLRALGDWGTFTSSVAEGARTDRLVEHATVAVFGPLEHRCIDGIGGHERVEDVLYLRGVEDVAVRDLRNVASDGGADQDRMNLDLRRVHE